MGERVLKLNDAVARSNRTRYDEAGVVAVNFIGSPGSGKTAVLERTVTGLRGLCRPACIEGDPYTTRDALRIAALGCPVVQINTHGGCHLDATLVSQALKDLELEDVDLLLIENVGNLLCPSQYDLGEHFSVVVLSVTEGADKPEKYPAAFQRASAVILNKVDLLTMTDVDSDAVTETIHRFNPQAVVFPLSARTGEGVDPWLRWLAGKVRARR